jgi:chromosome segregation ATPase
MSTADISSGSEREGGFGVRRGIKNKALIHVLHPCRLSEKETEYKEQGSVKLQEWNKSLTPLQEWFVKTEQKLDSLESLESNMNNLKKQNQEYLALQKELELQKKRVTNVAVFGEETASHPSVSKEQRKNIEQSIVTVKNEWERLNEKVNWRLAGYVYFNTANADFV